MQNSLYSFYNNDNTSWLCHIQHIRQNGLSIFAFQLLHIFQVLSNLETDYRLFLEEFEQFLSLHGAEYVVAAVSQDGHAEVDLVVSTQHNTHAYVVAYLLPVKVVPEALTEPLLTDLQ